MHKGVFLSGHRVAVGTAEGKEGNAAYSGRYIHFLVVGQHDVEVAVGPQVAQVAYRDVRRRNGRRRTVRWIPATPRRRSQQRHVGGGTTDDKEILCRRTGLPSGPQFYRRLRVAAPRLFHADGVVRDAI